jgi:hypothetical protein
MVGKYRNENKIKLMVGKYRNKTKNQTNGREIQEQS